MTDGRVLIIDDSLTVRMDVAAALEAQGFATGQARTAVEARAALGEDAWDAVILDVLLPDGDGIDIIEDIRGGTTNVDTGILVLSTEAEVHDRIRGLNRGADDYVGKPYDLAYLVARTRELVQARRPSPHTRPAVIVVEDSPTVRHELGQALRAAGYTVTTAATGPEGLQMAGAQCPDAVIVDEMLPGCTGSTLIRRIRLDAALRDVPCLLYTADTSAQAQLAALDAGADSFLGKDEPMDIVLAKLAVLLRQREATAPRVHSPSLNAPKRILAVDDSPTYLHELETSLRGAGYDVVLAQSGHQALQLLTAQPVDCILLDLYMPELTGQQTCTRIKQAPSIRNIPVIVLTGQENQATMLESFACGADDYVTKSADFEVLKARVQAQLRRKQFDDERRVIREELLRRQHEVSEARMRQEAAEARAALVDELQRSNEELQAFSSSISHDLRAPLRVILSFTDLLLAHHQQQLDETAREHLRRIGNATHRMQAMIEDLLKLSTIGRGEPIRVAVDISALANDVVTELRAADRHRVVHVSISEGITVHGDPAQMRLALQNLIGNAWKFTDRVPEARIEVSPRAGHGASFSVSDNGVGFDMSRADLLYAPFQRLHTKEDYPGNGVGLAIVQRIIHRHHGSVHADSAPGRGTTFTVTLPPADPPREPTLAPHDESLRPAATVG